MSAEETINVTLKNCNNIKEANISLIKNNLNLRYALNGTGKSTLSKAIQLASKNTDLSKLKPFGSSDAPQVEISQVLNEVLVFNEEFVTNTVFKESEVIEKGFEVFIKSPDYDERLNSLNSKLSVLKIGIQENPDFQEFTNLIDAIAQKLKLNSDGSVKNDTILKSLTAKDNIYKVPKELEIFKPFLQNNEINYEWADWKTKGENFDSVAGCPYCTKDLGENYLEQKKVFQASCKKTNIKNLKDMLDNIEAIKAFLNVEKYELLINCIKRESDADTILQEITKLRVEIEGITKKIGNIIRFNQIDIKREQISEIGEYLKDSKIAIAGIDYFSSEKSISIFSDINDKIEDLIKIVEDLKKEIGSFMGFVLSSIKSAKDDINLFLKTAGINYELDIIQNGQNDIQTILKYRTDDDKHDVDKIREHLSWGEKNAFSLVLFMHYALSRGADLIILDDPISSFDDNKKYAIINRLFGKHSTGKCLYKRTVLMLSHDFEPIIDFIINNKPTGGFVNAEYFWNRDGIIENKPLCKSDVYSWISLLKGYAKDESKCIINRLAFLRKYTELVNDAEPIDYVYQIISSLQHGYQSAKIKQGENLEEMPQSSYEKGVVFIKDYITDFDYQAISSNTSNAQKVVQWYKEQTNNYFKLQIFRCFLEIDDKRNQIKDDNLLKYIDETYHIENDYIYFVDLEKYEIVPDHIIKECDAFLNRHA